MGCSPLPKRLQLPMSWPGRQSLQDVTLWCNFSRTMRLPKYLERKGTTLQCWFGVTSCLCSCEPTNMVKIWLWFADNEVHNSQVCAEAGTLVVQVYMLGTMSHLKNMELDNIVASDIKNLEAKTVWFGPQMHLLISDSARPELICSKVLESTSASEVYQLKDVWSSLNKDNVDVQSCPELDYVYHIFDKFSTRPPLPETQGKQVDRCLKVLLRDSTGLGNTPELGAKCISHMKDGI